MKPISLAFITLILSCNSTIDAEWEYKKFKRAVDPLLEKFEKRFPNYQDNSIVREKATYELGLFADTLLSLEYLKQIPLKVLKLQKLPNDDRILVHFYTDNYDYKINRLSDRLNFDILGYLNENLASKIKEDSKYYVYGKNYAFLNRTKAFSIVKQLYYSPEKAIQLESGKDYSFNIGVIACDVDSIKKVGKYDIPN